ncbi:MAG TPA: C45 family peptidase [Gaiellales bacterium]|nr:C45 family peptidase [Gaiellales bacterium]
MPPRPIDLVRVAGTHREIGNQIGAATAAVVRRHAAAMDARRLAEAAAYRDVTAAELPWLIEELDGVAEGTGADPLAVFAAGIEEIAVEEPAPASRCSDLVATAPSTADLHVWAAHNNDLGPESEEELVAIEWSVPGDPVLFTLGIGPWISVGFNSAGLALTGNELSPNDDRVGIPRLLLVRDILRRRTLAEATDAALHPRRASSYNNLLSHRDGGVCSVEGSATDAELLRPDERGTLAHTNHYTSARMAVYERDPGDIEGSCARQRSARAWLESGPVTPQLLREALSDHAGAPDSLCRHVEHGAQSKTVFWCLADVTEGTIRYGRGNPCDSQEQRYAFN